MKYKVLLCLVLLLAMPTFASGQEKPEWAEVGKYVKHSSHIYQCVEGTDYTADGTTTITVEEVHEDHATVKVIEDLTWSPSQSPVYTPDPTSQQWTYQWSTSYYIGSGYLENLKAGTVSAVVENIYKGVKSIATPYGTIKCFYFYENLTYGVYYTRSETYYDYNTGMLVKRSAEGTYGGTYYSIEH